MQPPNRRRDVLKFAAGATLLGLAPGGLVHAAAPALARPAPMAPLGTASVVIDKTKAFLASLPEAKRKAASFSQDSSQWRNWNYFGVGGYVKPGLRLEQMSAAERDAALDIFATLLSPTGLEKARTVMLLQDVLVELGNGVGARSGLRFSVSVHGEPSPTSAFGLRIEGHHLSLSFWMEKGAVVAVTPAAFAALPNRVPGGSRKGLVTLVGEEMTARRLEAEFTPKQRERARVSESRLFNILSSAGSERANTRKIGIAASDMGAVQRELLWQLIETYAVAPYPAAIANAQRARIRAGDPAAVHFAWHGPNTAGRSFGYQIVGDTFVIELGCIDSEAQHLHPVYHDLGNTLGLPA